MLRNSPLSAVLNEEVALEGLEGTTLDTLWNHLAIRLKIKMPVPQKFCHSVWALIVQNSEYMFFQLPEPRKPFVYFDRMEQADSSTGVMKEPKEYPGHRFKYNPITANGIRGSCECYETRQVVSREELAAMSYQDVENRWPNTFIIVASQKMRESTIIEPNCTSELSIIQYCILEWIARSRYNGETSQGKFSLVELTKDSSILYYNRKFLTDCKLITRQALCQRTGETSIQGMVYHLPRYYCEMKPKSLLITEKVVNVLKARPNFMADYDEIKLIVLGRAEARKWFRGNEFTKFVRTDETVAYRTLYPDAEPREYTLKNKRNEEKQIRIMRLIDPEADVYDLWYKEEQPEEDQKDGFLDSQKAYIDMPVLQQAYNVIANSGEQGISQSMLAVQMGLDRLNARALVKNLIRIKAVEGSAVDEGRQRTTKYFLPGMNQRTLTFDKEAIQLMASHHSLAANAQEQQPQQQQQASGSPVVLQPPLLQLPIPLASTSGTTNLSESSSSFSTTAGQEHLDEEDEERYKMHLNLYSQANSTMLDSIEVEINISDEVAGLKKTLGGISALNSKHISAKVLKRCNLILELVKTYQVVEPREVLKKINKDEREKGFQAEACHKSVLRLIGRLAVDKYLKIANVKLSKEDKVINVVYACEMAVDKESPSLKGKIEAAKARMMLSAVGQTSAKKPLTEKETMHATVGTSYEGTLAKCLRMRLFHEFLFYLIYELSPDTVELHGMQLERMDLSSAQEDLGPVYIAEPGWKMFVPPLNVYESYGQGWALVTDVTLRLPLSVFCQICTFGFYTKELDYWLNHPIRQHMLIKQLPKQVRLQLFRQRKYIFNIYELCQKLCYAGLLQFGPQRMKDRDQTFIYVNRNAALLDTRESAVGYHEIEERDYPVKAFKLDCMDDLHSYWENLYKIALGTRLNRRSAVVGKDILVQQLHVKPEIMEACKTRTPEQAIELDVPRLPPGDNHGAAGMDTAMFVHLKSNWSKVMNYAPAVKNHLAKLKRMKTMKKIAQLHKPTAVRTTISKKIMSTGKEKKLCLKAKLTVKPFASTYKRFNDKKHTIKIRRIEKRSVTKRKKAHYDDIDREALKQMDKLRVDWSPNEDTVLLLCRIALRYLYGEVLNSNIIINSAVYRDILHWSNPGSSNKTSRACQRRINYMVKQKPGVAANVKLCVEEARLNPVIEQRFGKNFIGRLKTFYLSSEDLAMALKIHFIELVFLLRNTLTKLKMTEGFRPMEGLKRPKESQFIPDTVAEFEQGFNILQAYDEPETLNFKANPTNTEEIIVLKLTTLIHSAVVTARAKGTLGIQLFNVYKNYSEKHLSAAMKMVRSFRLISLSRKLKLGPDGKKTVMPSMGDNPYHISITYLNQISTKIPFQMFSHVYFHYIRLLDRPSFEEPLTLDDGRQGLVLLLGELVSVNGADLELETLGELRNNSSDLRDEFGGDFGELGQAADTREQQLPEGPAKRIKTEPRSAQKVHFATTSDVFFNYVMHPVEKLTKIPSEYLHFFCVLNTLKYGTMLRTFKIDETCNICSIENCILQSTDRNIIQTCIAIALEHRETIERIKANRASRIDMTPLLAIREDNIAQYFMRIIKEYGRLQAAFQKRDFGRLPEGMKSYVNMVDLIYDIVQFQNVQEFNWLDRYEITQLDDDTGNALLMDPEGNEAEFTRDKAAHGDDMPDKTIPVNYMKINARLTYQNPEELRDRTNHNNRLIPKVFLPQNFTDCQDILAKITNDTLWPSRDQLEPLLEEAAPLIHRNPHLSAVAIFIEEKADLGASVHELGEKFRNHAELGQHLQMLLNFKFILRTGFRHMTYVHWQYVTPWLLRTSCVMRGESQNVAGSVGSVRIKQEPGTSQPKRPIAAQSSDEESDDIMEEDEAGEFGPPPKNRRDEFQRKIAVIEERDRLKPKKNLSLAMTPWIKINGGIDRRLIYRWLTTLLLYCMSHPGVLLSVLYARFNLMAPVHLYYLLEILRGYGCVNMFTMEVRQKRSLFSTYRPPKVDPATEFDREECTYIEATANALSTLTLFLGEYPKFQEDFLSQAKTNEPLDGEQSE